MSGYSELMNLVYEGESETVEFQSRANTNIFVPVICAFANTKGGKILVGVEQMSEVGPSGGQGNVGLVGIDKSQTESVLAGIIEEFAPPAPLITHEYVEGTAKELFCIVNVAKSASIVRLKNGTSYTRDGIRNIQHSDAPSTASVTAVSQGQSPDVFTGTANLVAGKATLSAGENYTPPPADETKLEEKTEQTPGEAEGSPPLAVEIAGEIPKPVADTSRVGSAYSIRREAGENEHSLHVGEYAAALKSLFETAKDEEALCFGVFGHWGRGKTFLLNEVSKRIRGNEYEVVSFSAWKYRTTPEVWAHLYETFLEAARQGNWFVPARASFVRSGPWPAIGALLSLIVSLITASQKIDIFWYIFSVIGVLGVVYCLFLYNRFHSLFSEMRAHYAGLASHADKLGLQAAIGRDLKALLIGWMPKDYFKPRLQAILPLVCYVSGIVVVALLLWNYLANAGALVKNTAVGLWVVVTVLGPLICFFYIGKSKRLLFVIDDLDRCPPDQMLEIVESIMLLLHDIDVRNRLQVVMLVEESALEAALKKKYGFLAEAAGNGKLHGHILDRVVRENLEKIFLAHLRLPPIDNLGLKELMEKFVGEISERENVPPSTTGVVTDTPTSPPVVPKVPKHENGTAEVVQSDIGIGFTFSREERVELLRAVNRLRQSGYPGTWGPRSIRCFIFRYQLARLLLSQLNQTIVPRTLIDALLAAQADQAPQDHNVPESQSPTPVSESAMAEIIARQVS